MDHSDWPRCSWAWHGVDLIALETFKGTTEKTLSLHVAAGCGVSRSCTSR